MNDPEAVKWLEERWARAPRYIPPRWTEKEESKTPPVEEQAEQLNPTD